MSMLLFPPTAADTLTAPASAHPSPSRHSPPPPSHPLHSQFKHPMQQAPASPLHTSVPSAHKPPTCNPIRPERAHTIIRAVWDTAAAL